MGNKVQASSREILYLVKPLHTVKDIITHEAKTSTRIFGIETLVTSLFYFECTIGMQNLATRQSQGTKKRETNIFTWNISTGKNREIESTSSIFHLPSKNNGIIRFGSPL